jgi:hypothetical protein
LFVSGRASPVRLAHHSAPGHADMAQIRNVRVVAGLEEAVILSPSSCFGEDVMTLTSITLDAQLAKAGPVAATFARLWGKLWQQPYISAELLDLCRLTFARLHEDEAEQAAQNSHASALTAERRAAVLKGAAFDNPAFTARDRAVLLFAEYYWTDTQTIPDEAADDVKRHIGETGLMFLIEALGVLDGRIRTARVMRDIAAHSSAKAKEAAYAN